MDGAALRSGGQKICIGDNMSSNLTRFNDGGYDSPPPGFAIVTRHQGTVVNPEGGK